MPQTRPQLTPNIVYGPVSTVKLGEDHPGPLRKLVEVIIGRCIERRDMLVEPHTQLAEANSAISHCLDTLVEIRGERHASLRRFYRTTTSRVPMDSAHDVQRRPVRRMDCQR